MLHKSYQRQTIQHEMLVKAVRGQNTGGEGRPIDANGRIWVRMPYLLAAHGYEVTQSNEQNSPENPQPFLKDCPFRQCQEKRGSERYCPDVMEGGSQGKQW